jgi:hypothetical protein
MDLWRLQAATLDVLLDQLLQLINVPLLLGFDFSPESLQLRSAVGIGDEPVVLPEATHPPAQIVDQIVIVRFDFPRLNKIPVIPHHGFRHAAFPLTPASARKKKTDVAEHPQVFRHIGLLLNEPPGVARLPFI